MTTLDPAHLPSRHDHRGQAVTQAQTSSGRPRGPPIPDLRFEQSYLLSIQSFISFSKSPLSHTPTTAPSDPQTAKAERHKKVQGASEKLGLVDSGDSGENEVVESLYGVPLDIRWRGVAWVTARDQIISPLMQGALWGLLGIFITPVTTQAGQSIRSLLGLNARRRPQLANSPEDISWFRRWVRSFYTGVETNVALSR